MGSRDKERLYQQRWVFDEESMLQEKSESEDKAQGEALGSSADTQVRELSSQMTLKSLMGQMRNPHIQMETNMRLLRSNIDR